MGLIICPECNKEISDQVEHCIHCGYPLSRLLVKDKNTVCNIKGVDFDFTDDLIYIFKHGKGSFKNLSQKIEQQIQLDAFDVLNLLSEIVDNKEVPKVYIPQREGMTQSVQALARFIPDSAECPYCQSKNTKKISTVGRATSFGLFGFGSSKLGKQWHCNKCGSNF